MYGCSQHRGTKPAVAADSTCLFVPFTAIGSNNSYIFEEFIGCPNTAGVLSLSFKLHVLPITSKRDAKVLQQTASDLQRSIMSSRLRTVCYLAHCPADSSQPNAAPDGQRTSTERTHFRFCSRPACPPTPTNRTVTPPRRSTSCRVSLVPDTLNGVIWCDGWKDEGQLGRRFVF
jgi:hypothetical protein